jgi:hypothetical protein
MIKPAGQQNWIQVQHVFQGMVHTQWLILPWVRFKTCDTQKSVQICNEFSKKDGQTILVIQVISSRNDKNICIL